MAHKIDALAPVVDAWLAADPRLKASVIHERLVAEHGFDGHYQRVKLYVAEARQRLARDGEVDDRLSGLHRRFEVVAGAQAQVDWGDEGQILLDAGIARVYSFHMTLSYSRDPFCCFTTSQDLGTFFDCHRRAFAHFGGVPDAIVWFDRFGTAPRRRPPPCRRARGGPAASGGRTPCLRQHPHQRRAEKAPTPAEELSDASESQTTAGDVVRLTLSGCSIMSR